MVGGEGGGGRLEGKGGRGKERRKEREGLQCRPRDMGLQPGERRQKKVARLQTNRSTHRDPWLAGAADEVCNKAGEPTANTQGTQTANRSRTPPWRSASR